MTMKLKLCRQLKYLTPLVSVLFLVAVIWNYRPAHISEDQQRTQRTATPTYPKGCGPGQMWPFSNVDPHDTNGLFLPLNGTHTLLISAYLEHRTISRQVRVIAVVLRSEQVEYRCLFCCERTRHISKATVNIHMDHYGFVYGTADIMCPLPSHCENPSHIAVTPENSEVTQSAVYMEVLNKEARTDHFPHNFTVCLSAMFDFNNVLQLVQSMEMLKVLGVSRVVVYKTSCSPQVQQLLDYYIRTGLMEVIPWSLSRFMTVSHSWLPSLSPGDIHYYGQIPAISDCLYRYMYQSKYLAVHDMDELILPQMEDSWNEMFPVLEEMYGADLCYKFKNHVFPNTIKLPPPSSHTYQHPHGSCCKSWEKLTGVNILDHLYHEPPINVDQNYKDIFNPRIVFEGTVHGLLKSKTGCVWVDDNIARMYHTRPAAQPQLSTDQLIYDDRLLGYKARLIYKVNSVLKEAGIKPQDSRDNSTL